MAEQLGDWRQSWLLAGCRASYPFKQSCASLSLHAKQEAQRQLPQRATDREAMGGKEKNQDEPGGAAAGRCGRAAPGARAPPAARPGCRRSPTARAPPSRAWKGACCPKAGRTPQELPSPRSAVQLSRRGSKFPSAEGRCHSTAQPPPAGPRPPPSAERQARPAGVTSAPAGTGERYRDAPRAAAPSSLFRPLLAQGAEPRRGPPAPGPLSRPQRGRLYLPRRRPPAGRP